MARLEREWTEVAERKKAVELKARLAELAEIDSVTNSESLCEYLVRAAKHAALVRAVPGKTNTITRDFDSFDFAKLSFSRPRFAQPGGAVLEKLQREATADMTAAVAQDIADQEAPAAQAEPAPRRAGARGPAADHAEAHGRRAQAQLKRRRAALRRARLRGAGADGQPLFFRRFPRESIPRDPLLVGK